MCTTCGCSDNAEPSLTDMETGENLALREHSHAHEHGHDHGHKHGHAHEHSPEHNHGQTIVLEQAVLAKNDEIASRNRKWFAQTQILALNLMSSPGAGKTALLVRTILDIGDASDISVVEGDQATLNDAQRIRETGCAVVQVNTGTGCHLEANMLQQSLDQLKPETQSVLMIENVGNLVCPALFDLGENARVVILSVPEGDDKPIKYPHMFRACDLMIINKMDLLPYVDFDLDRCVEYARQVNPSIDVITLSAKTGEGLEDWYRWIGEHAPFDWPQLSRRPNWHDMLTDLAGN